MDIDPEEVLGQLAPPPVEEGLPSQMPPPGEMVPPSEPAQGPYPAEPPPLPQEAAAAMGIPPAVPEMMY